jgi:hypothetical protein
MDQWLAAAGRNMPPTIANFDRYRWKQETMCLPVRS